MLYFNFIQVVSILFHLIQLPYPILFFDLKRSFFIFSHLFLKTKFYLSPLILPPFSINDLLKEIVFINGFIPLLFSFFFFLSLLCKPLTFLYEVGNVLIFDSVSVRISVRQFFIEFFLCVQKHTIVLSSYHYYIFIRQIFHFLLLFIAVELVNEKLFLSKILLLFLLLLSLLKVHKFIQLTSIVLLHGLLRLMV